MGYLFRPVTNQGVVLSRALPYNAAYCCLKHYLKVLGIDNGETPYSMRSRCAITVGVLSGDAADQALKQHVGWSTEESLNHYSRLPLFHSGNHVSKLLSEVVNKRQGTQVRSKYSDVALENDSAFQVIYISALAHWYTMQHIFVFYNLHWLRLAV